MNTLIITYNVKDINIINHDPVLYLVEGISGNIKKKLIGKHVSITKEKDIYLEIIDQIKKYYNHFDYIMLLDNSNEYIISEISTNEKLPSNWIITGNFHSEIWDQEKFIPGYYNLNKLMFNCKFLDDSILSLLNSDIIKEVSFPPLSKIRYAKYTQSFEMLCKGVSKVKKCENILL